MEASPKDWRAVSSLYIQSCRAFLTRSRWKAPSIWLVTGVHLISDGRVHAGWNAGLNMQGGISADAGTLAGGPPTGKPAADVQGSLKKNIHMENLYGQSGERVWCAQFMELAVDFTNGPQRNESQGWFTRLLPKREVEVLQLRQVSLEYRVVLDIAYSGISYPCSSSKPPDPIFFPPTSGNF